ncbi:MAG: hypothetical protein HQL52_09520 [Magnetococcales bacterium]|nr:hypothetical protein [Magnetococcales bacterium]
MLTRLHERTQRLFPLGFFKPSLPPLLAALATVLGGILLLPHVALPFITTYAERTDDHLRSAWHVERLVHRFKPRGEANVIILGGSQVMQGFPSSERMAEIYQQRYREQVRFLEVGYSFQSIASYLQILTYLDINENSVVFLHTAPSKFSTQGLNTDCHVTRHPTLYSDDYFALTGESFDLACRFRKYSQLLYRFHDAVRIFARRQLLQWQGKPLPPAIRFDKFGGEKAYLADPIQWVRNKISLNLEQEAQAKAEPEAPRPPDFNQNKRNLLEDKTKNVFPAAKKNQETKTAHGEPAKKPSPAEIREEAAQRAIRLFQTAIDYLRSKGARVVLFTMPYNPGFPNGMPGYHPSSHQNHPRISQWLTHRLPKKSLAADIGFNVDKKTRNPGLSQLFLDRVAQLPAPFHPFQVESLTASDFYDSSHMIRSGREKFMPDFMEVVKREIAARTGSTDNGAINGRAPPKPPSQIKDETPQGAPP